MKKILYALVLLVAFAACEKKAETTLQPNKAELLKQKKEDSLALKIAVLPTLDAFPLYLAKERGLYDKHKVDVRLKRFNAQMDADTAIAGGSVEGVMTDLVRAERLKKNGLQLDYLASTNLYWLLISNRSSRIKTLSQLGDKMVAMTRYSATDYLTDQVLQGVKLTGDVYRVQINDVDLRLDMLINNEIDALWLPEPHATKAISLKHSVIADSRKMDVRLGVMAFRQGDNYRKKQQTALIKVYNEACDSINKYSLANYQDVIEKYYGVDAAATNAIPKQNFSHAAAPSQNDVDKALKFLGK